MNKPDFLKAINTEIGKIKIPRSMVVEALSGEAGATNLARLPLLAGLRRKKTDRGQRSVFPSETSQLAPFILAHRGFSTPLVRRRSNCPLPSPNLVRTHPMER